MKFLSSGMPEAGVLCEVRPWPKLIEDNVKEELIKFFMWFQYNGDKYVDRSIEDMIDIYLSKVEYDSDRGYFWSV